MVTKTEIIPSGDNLVVSLETAKKHLRLDAEFTEEDDLVSIYIGSAQAHAENFIGRAVGEQHLVIQTDQFETVVFEASLNDILEKVEYYPAGSEELTLLPDTAYAFRKNGLDAWEVKFKDPVPESEVRDDAVTITVKRGYEAGDCPVPIVQAMLLLISDSYERREDRGEIGYNSASNSLMRPYRRWH